MGDGGKFAISTLHNKAGVDGVLINICWRACLAAPHLTPDHPRGRFDEFSDYLFRIFIALPRGHAKLVPPKYILLDSLKMSGKIDRLNWITDLFRNIHFKADHNHNFVLVYNFGLLLLRNIELIFMSKSNYSN